MTEAMRVVSSIVRRAARIAGDTSVRRNPCRAASAPTLSLSRAPADRAVVIVRYAAEPAGANPSAALLKPITIRFDRGLFVVTPLVLVANPTCSGDREKVAPNRFRAIDVTVPMIVGPFPATNDTDAPPI